MAGEINNTILSGYFTVLKTLGLAKTEAAGELVSGQKLIAQVIAKEGDNYLLQSGDQRFSGLSKIPFTVGQKLELIVAGHKEGKVWLKVKPPEPEINSMLSENEPADDLAETRSLVKRYGIINEKDILEIHNLRLNMPVDESSAIRYLLDPHLLTAILMPGMFFENSSGKIEVSQYKNPTDKQNVWEISLDMSLEKLGLIEIKLRLIDKQVYAQIWAELQETETLIRGNMRELKDDRLMVEIIPVKQGPLIYREKDNIDYRI